MAHDGNVRQASAAIGVAYGTLRDLYMGRALNPGIGTLKRIASAYDIPDAWFTDEKQGEAVPLSGYLGLLPPDPEWKPMHRYSRDVLIPHVAREFAEVWDVLFDYLDGRKPEATRPIVGDATEREFTRRLTTFLLRPLLEAAQTGLTQIPVEMPLQGDKMFRSFSDEELEEWAQTLRQLGRFWQIVLKDLLDTARKALRSNPQSLPDQSPHSRRQDAR